MYTISFTRIGAGVATAFALLLPSLASAAQVNIAVGDNYFNPNNTTINVGDTVVWTNVGSMPHTIKADNGAFVSATLQSGQSFSYTFTNAGGFPYYCTLHGGAGGSGMAGRITVAGQPTVVNTGLNTQAQIQAQAQALLQQVALLQQQIAAQQGGANVSTGSGTGQGVAGLAQQAGVQVVDSSACPQIGRTLKKGVSGSDVTRLQQFLARDPSIYPEGTVSGYYGALTEAAVKRWQTKFNIVSSGTPDTTGFGVVGPRTAAAISLQCSLYAGGGGSGGAVSPVGGYIQVSPVAGNAPLTVNVQATVNTTKSCAGAVYTLSWGDSTGGVQIPVSAGNCNQLSQTYSHTYTYGGIYLMTLSALGHTTTASVTVYGQSAPNPTPTPVNPTPTPTPTPSAYGPFSVTPNAGGNPLAVTATFDLPTACTSYDLSWGDGTTSVTGQSSGSCASGTVQPTLTHQYAVAGTYSIVLKRGASLDKVDTATLSISN